MTIKEVTLERLSICDCGFPCLDDSIKLGTKYLIDTDISVSEDYMFYCGGCHKTHYDVSVIQAGSILNPSALFAPLPNILFQHV